jgi:hypothetical protein
MAFMVVFSMVSGVVSWSIEALSSWHFCVGAIASHDESSHRHSLFSSRSGKLMTFFATQIKM